MSGDIKAGDMVEVVGPTQCCGSRKSIGIVFCVVKVEAADALGRCPTCGELLPKSDVLAFSVKGNGCELFRLKKIDPPKGNETLSEWRRITA